MTEKLYPVFFNMVRDILIPLITIALELTFSVGGQVLIE